MESKNDYTQKMFDLLQACLKAFNELPNRRLISVPNLEGKNFQDTYQIAKQIGNLGFEMEIEPPRNVDLADLVWLTKTYVELTHKDGKNFHITDVDACIDMAEAFHNDYGHIDYEKSKMDWPTTIEKYFDEYSG